MPWQLERIRIKTAALGSWERRVEIREERGGSCLWAARRQTQRNRKIILAPNFAIGEEKARRSCPLGSLKPSVSTAEKVRTERSTKQGCHLAAEPRGTLPCAARGQKSGGELLGQLVEKSGEIRCCLGSTWRRLGNEGLREEGCCAVLRTVKQLER